MKKVLIITYYWPPSGGPGVQRWLKFVQNLPQHGIEPIVITVDPLMASYPLVDQSLLDNVPEKLEVHKTKTSESLRVYTKIIPGAQLPMPGFSNQREITFFQKIIRFIRGNFFIPDARVGWNRYAIKKCIEVIHAQKIDAIITTSPPHSSQLIGHRLKKETGIAWIADLRDPWTDIYYNRNLFRLNFSKRKDIRLEKLVLENADAIITVSKSLKNLFISKSNIIDPDKIHVIPNGFDELDFQNNTTATSGVFTITYTGTMSDDYPVRPFIEALEHLVKSTNCRPVINLIGHISKGVGTQLKQSVLAEYIVIQEYVTHMEAIKAMLNTTVLLLIIPDVPNNEGILTGKLFEYMAARRPILGFGPSGSDATEIIDACASGRIFGYSESLLAGEWLLSLYHQWVITKLLSAGNEHIEYYSKRYQIKQLTEIIKTRLCLL